MFSALRNAGAAAIGVGLVADFVMYDVDGGTRAVRMKTLWREKVFRLT